MFVKHTAEHGARIVECPLPPPENVKKEWSEERWIIYRPMSPWHRDATSKLSIAFPVSVCFVMIWSVFGAILNCQPWWASSKRLPFWKIASATDICGVPRDESVPDWNYTLQLISSGKSTIFMFIWVIFWIIKKNVHGALFFRQASMTFKFKYIRS